MNKLKLCDKTIGIGITGSFCTFNKILKTFQDISNENANMIPIFSNTVNTTDNRFMSAGEFRKKVTDIMKNEPLTTILQAEPIGPKSILDIMLIAPCTGNTLAKLVNGITDSPVLMAAKAHLRNSKPLVVSISTNDALGTNFKNIGEIMNMKNIYLVPFYQDDYTKKPNSMVADVSYIIPTLEMALEGKQFQPVIIA